MKVQLNVQRISMVFEFDLKHKLEIREKTEGTIRSCNFMLKITSGLRYKNVLLIIFFYSLSYRIMNSLVHVKTQLLHNDTFFFY